MSTACEYSIIYGKFGGNTYVDEVYHVGDSRDMCLSFPANSRFLIFYTLIDFVMLTSYHNIFDCGTPSIHVLKMIINQGSCYYHEQFNTSTYTM